MFDRRDLNRLGKAVRFSERHNAPSTAAPYDPRRGPVDIIVAKLTSRDGTDNSLYAWSQAIRNGTGWDTPTGWLSGTTTSHPAIDPRTQALRFDMTNKFVVLARGQRKVVTEGEGSTDTTTDYEGVWYVIGFPVPVGMYQYDVLQNLTDATVGYQPVAGHPEYT